MIKIINLCPVCGGKGIFLTQRCMSCGGSGGEILKCDSKFATLLEQSKARLSEQEMNVFQVYKRGLAPKEIAKQLDLSIPQLCVVLHRIEKKINSL